MLQTTLVTSRDELVQIHKLNQKNLRENVSIKEQKEQGFVTWLYSMELLEQMHELAPSVIVKDYEQVAAYALTTLKEASAFHPDLAVLFNKLQQLNYKGQPLTSYNFYCMGQICVAAGYRGKNIVNSLYQKHKEIYSSQYQFILTEISTNNPRSQRAHEKIGFITIHTHVDEVDEWNIVVWDWN